MNKLKMKGYDDYNKLDNENWKWVYAIDSFIDTKTLL
jgi:hypothetical protein